MSAQTPPIDDISQSTGDDEEDWLIDVIRSRTAPISVIDERAEAVKWKNSLSTEEKGERNEPKVVSTTEPDEVLSKMMSLQNSLLQKNQMVKAEATAAATAANATTAAAASVPRQVSQETQPNNQDGSEDMNLMKIIASRSSNVVTPVLVNGTSGDSQQHQPPEEAPPIVGIPEKQTEQPALRQVQTIPGAFACGGPGNEPFRSLDNVAPPVEEENTPDPEVVNTESITGAVDAGVATDIVSARLVSNDDIANQEVVGEAEPIDLEAAQERKVAESHLRGKFFLLAFIAFIIVGIVVAVIVQKQQLEVSQGPETSIPAQLLTVSPSAAPTSVLDSFLERLPDRTRLSLQNSSSPQWKAYVWLQAHRNIADLEDWRKSQLFSLVTFYYAFEGPDWPQAIRDDWLDDSRSECYWFSSRFGSFDADRRYSLDLSEAGDDPCDENGRFQALILADLELMDFDPILPPEIDMLTSLSTLALPKNGLNVSLAKLIPSSLYHMTSLIKVDLHMNDISGEVPSDIGSLTSLKGLDLSSNRLSGSIISEIGLLSNVEWLALYDNDLEGNIASEIGQCTNIRHLFIGDNYDKWFSQLPSELGMLSNMIDFGVWEVYLTGTIPTEIGQWGSSTVMLDLGGTALSGTIPSELGLLTKLTELATWETDLTGTIPTELGLCTDMVFMFLGGSDFLSLPSELGFMAKLEELDVWENQFSELPSSLGRCESLVNLNLGGCQIGGSLPATLGLLTNLKTLSLWENQIIGPLPSSLGLMESLEYLDLGGNQISGVLPSEIGMLVSLEGLALWENQVSGSLPSTLGLLTSLEYLDLGGNRITGALPSEIGMLASLEELAFWENQVSGSLPSTIGLLTSLEYLDIGGNHISGAVPRELSKLYNLTYFHAWGNALDGLPREIGMLTNLEVLDLSDNSMNETKIPEGLCELGPFDDSTGLGLFFDCGAGVCGCYWCPCAEGV